MLPCFQIRKSQDFSKVMLYENCHSYYSAYYLRFHFNCVLFFGFILSLSLMKYFCKKIWFWLTFIFFLLSCSWMWFFQLRMFIYDRSNIFDLNGPRNLYQLASLRPLWKIMNSKIIFEMCFFSFYHSKSLLFWREFCYIILDHKSTNIRVLACVPVLIKLHYATISAANVCLKQNIFVSRIFETDCRNLIHSLK